MGKIKDFLFGKKRDKSGYSGFGSETIIDYPDSNGVFNSSLNNANYSAAVNEGFYKNQVVYHIVKEIANAGSGIPIKTDNKDVEKLLKSPTPQEGYSSWMNKLIIQKLLSGNAYIWVVESGGKPKVLRNLRPDRVEVKTGKRNGFDEQLIEYIYTNGGAKKFEVKEMGESELFHSKFYDPLDDWSGISPIQSAMLALNQNNEMASMNKTSLENGGTLKGFIAMQDGVDKAGIQLDEEQLISIQKNINDKLGRKGRGINYPIMNLPFRFEQLGMTQEEMQFIESKEVTARDIAIAFNYPAYLLGFADGATFNNVTEARETLYENNIIPLVQTILDDFERYYLLNFKQEIKIELDVDAIVALQNKIKVRKDSAREDFKAGLISDIEWRREAGMSDEPEEGTRYFPSGVIPEDLVSLDFNAPNQEQQ